MSDSLRDQLKQWEKKNMQGQKRKRKPVKSKPVKKPKEKFSEKDLRELMGSNRKVLYRGKGGALR